MEKTEIAKRKIKSKLSAIKRLQDNPKLLTDQTYDAYKDDLDTKNGIVKKNINDFTSKTKGKTQNKKDIFADILDTVDGFLGSDKEDPTNPKQKPLVQSKIMRYAKQSAQKAMNSSREMVLDEVKKSFFTGQGCDPNTPISGVALSPKSFDFTNMLKVSPDSTSGKIMYETSPDPGIGIQFNRKLYETFDSSYPGFYKKDNTKLFDMSWNSGTQMYEISNIAGKASTFLEDYYNTIEHSGIDNVMSNAMLLSLQGDGTEPSSFNVGMNWLNRLSTKLCSLCGNPSSGSSPLLNNATQQLDEDETDIQGYFDFDDVEGIDLDDEDARARRVLKFRDCDNFELPTNSNHMEDFTYLLGKKNLDELILNTLNKASIDAYGQADGSITYDAFQLSLTKSYILQIPRAMISAVLSPKMIFPIALTYKMIYGESLTVKDLMKKLANLFFNMVKKIFWTFIKEFWGFIRKDILSFVKNVASQMIKNLLAKYRRIVRMLIELLKKVLSTKIESCSDIFNAILSTIEMALNKSVKLPMPGFLLLLSKQLPGVSSDRAYMDAVERLENAGVNMGPLFGTENKLTTLVKSVIDAQSEEILSNGYVRITLEKGIIPATPGQATIIPGIVMGTGKLF